MASELEPEQMGAGAAPTPITLPWGATRDRASFPEHLHVTTSAKPGEFILQTLFAEFTVLAEKKIDGVLDQTVSWHCVDVGNIGILKCILITKTLIRQ